MHILLTKLLANVVASKKKQQAYTLHSNRAMGVIIQPTR